MFLRSAKARLDHAAICCAFLGHLWSTIDPLLETQVKISTYPGRQGELMLACNIIQAHWLARCVESWRQWWLDETAWRTARSLWDWDSPVHPASSRATCSRCHACTGTHKWNLKQLRPAGGDGGEEERRAAEMNSPFFQWARASRPRHLCLSPRASSPLTTVLESEIMTEVFPHWRSIA